MSPIPEDYAGAAARHFRDGTLLEKNQRISSADQLFGFATECAIKSALMSLPECARAGALASKYREHIDELWGLAPLQNIQKRYPKLILVLKGLKQPYADWSTDQRYWPDRMATEEALERHRKAAVRVLGSLGLSGTLREA